MKTNINFNFKITFLVLSLFISCQKNTDLEPIINQPLTNGENYNSDSKNESFRKIRRTPYTFEIKYQSETLMETWKGVYSLPDGFEFTYNKLVSTPQLELFLIGILTEKRINQKHIAIIKFDSNGEMVWNTLLQTTDNYKIEHAIEVSGDLYFISEVVEYSGKSQYYVNRIESSGEFAYARQIMQSREIPIAKNLIKMNDQLKFEIEYDHQFLSTNINQKDGAINEFKVPQNSPAKFTIDAPLIQFVERSIPIRRLIEGKYPPISNNQNQMASLD